MCGICGIVEYEGGGADFDQRLGPMIKVMKHRGPDQRGTWSDGHCGLGHVRLSIIDLSDGRQPLSNEDGTVWISYNGEIYNFQEIREGLLARGHTFKTRTDTEVIVHLYEEEGIECVKRFRGMFAFALWDARKDALFLARDPLGIKPLHYTISGRRFLFGSEIKAILAHGGVERAVREDALSDYLTFLYVPAPKTMFKGIHKLPAGHWLRFDRAGVSVNCYWDLQPEEMFSHGRGEMERMLIDRLQESVRRELVSDVPLGAFLSGGVDSSAVVAMMARSGQDPLITASIGFNEGRYNELPYARAVAHRYRTQHHEQIVRPEAASVVEKLAWHYDEPFADYSSIPTYYVSRAARQHVTVALSGDGGDENFGGYRRYRMDLLERRLRGLIPQPLRRWGVAPLAWLYPKADWLPRPLRAKITLQNVTVDAPTAYCRSVGFLSDEEKVAFYSPGLKRALSGYRSADIIRSYMNRIPSDQPLRQLLYTDLKTYLVDDILTKVDRASMAVSLEVRVPLLDHVFVEFAWRVPQAMKIERGGGKALLKSSLRPYVDEANLYRPKQGFTPPIKEWLRGPLAEMAGDLLLGGDARYADYLSQDVVRRAWRTHQRGLENLEPLLWAVLTFELWARKFLAGETTA